MRLLRTLSTRRLLTLVAGVVILVVAATAAVATAGNGSMPSAKPLEVALHDALTASHPEGLTARITFTNRLFPSGALTGEVGSALMSGASGRLWVTNDGRGRLELQSNAGDVQTVWNRDRVTVFDASSNIVYRADLPARRAEPAPESKGAPPSVAQIEQFLARLGEHATISGAEPDNVARREAYTVRVSPHDQSGLLGGASLAWDAARGVPLRVGIYARGAGRPVLELAATEITFGAVSASDVEVAPPTGAKVVDLTVPKRLGRSSGDTATGQSPPGTAPATLAGRQRTHLRVKDGTAVAVYGKNLGALVLVERKADSGSAGPLGSLPAVSLGGGMTAHELATPLLTALEWRRGGVVYVLAGSVPAGVAEAAAGALG